jgi:hypothetical protein
MPLGWPFTNVQTALSEIGSGSYFQSACAFVSLLFLMDHFDKFCQLSQSSIGAKNYEKSFSGTKL